MSAADLWVAAASWLPLCLVTLLAIRALRPAVIALAPWAAMPGLVLAIAQLSAPHAGLDAPLGHASLDLPALLLGHTAYARDAQTATFLGFTSLLWTVCAWFARSYLREDPRATSFWAFFLATMGGNVGGVLAQDLATFYAFFALMSLSAYGLVIHVRSAAALTAGRVYIVMTLIGDVTLLAALLFMLDGAGNLPVADAPASVAASPHRDIVVVLVLAGFGVKAGGLVPLHVWLPLAHPVAPAPASALLSGAMINMGLLGWLRFLPLGHAALPELGSYVCAAGLLAAFYAAAVGVTQREAKTVLAYSSVSQMGLMLLPIGVALAAPTSLAAARATILVFALHHALAKASLFLGTAVAKESRSRLSAWLVGGALSWSALEIAGAPLTSGSAAKLALGAVLKAAPVGVPALSTLASVAAIGSTLLMARFLILALPRTPGAPTGSERSAPRAGLWQPWALLLAVDTLVLTFGAVGAPAPRALLAPAVLVAAAWPLLIGLALSVLTLRVARRGAPVVPAGDVLFPLLRLVHLVQHAAHAVSTLAARHVRRAARSISAPQAPQARARVWEEAAEHHLLRFRTSGALLLALFVLLVALSSRG